MRPTTLAFGIFYSAISRDKRGQGDVAPPEPRLCGEMALAALPLGIMLYVFAPDDYNSVTGQLHGYCYSMPERRWRRSPVPLPDIVFDRRFPRTREERARGAAALEQMQLRGRCRLLGASLPSKWRVYESLQEDPELAALLPPTVAYESRAQLASMLERSADGIVLKPAAGMQGRGLLHLNENPIDGTIAATGRTRNNRAFALTFCSRDDVHEWLDGFMGRSAFIVQPYLALSDADNRPFDIRILLQKDGSGSWKLTGAAARVGLRGGLTSNLHGGGDARPAKTLLAANLGPSAAERLLKVLHTLSGKTARRLEERFGRFAELAFDFGIDLAGNLWLLEANAKPGRDAFRLIGDEEACRLAVLRPLQFARLLADRSAPTFTASQSASGPSCRRAIPLRRQAAALNVQEVHR